MTNDDLKIRLDIDKKALVKQAVLSARTVMDETEEELEKRFSQIIDKITKKGQAVMQLGGIFHNFFNEFSEAAGDVEKINKALSNMENQFDTLQQIEKKSGISGLLNTFNIKDLNKMLEKAEKANKLKADKLALTNSRDKIKNEAIKAARDSKALSELGKETNRNEIYNVVNAYIAEMIKKDEKLAPKDSTATLALKGESKKYAALLGAYKEVSSKKYAKDDLNSIIQQVELKNILTELQTLEKANPALVGFRKSIINGFEGVFEQTEKEFQEQVEKIFNKGFVSEFDSQTNVSNAAETVELRELSISITKYIQEQTTQIDEKINKVYEDIASWATERVVKRGDQILDTISSAVESFDERQATLPESKQKTVGTKRVRAAVGKPSRASSDVDSNDNPYFQYFSGLEEVKAKIDALLANDLVKSPQVNEGNFEKIKELIGYIQGYLLLGGDINNLNLDRTTLRRFNEQSMSNTYAAQVKEFKDGVINAFKEVNNEINAQHYGSAGNAKSVGEATAETVVDHPNEGVGIGISSEDIQIIKNDLNAIKEAIISETNSDNNDQSTEIHNIIEAINGINNLINKNISLSLVSLCKYVQDIGDGLSNIYTVLPTSLNDKIQNNYNNIIDVILSQLSLDRYVDNQGHGKYLNERGFYFGNTDYTSPYFYGNQNETPIYLMREYALKNKLNVKYGYHTHGNYNKAMFSLPLQDGSNADLFGAWLDDYLTSRKSSNKNFNIEKEMVGSLYSLQVVNTKAFFDKYIPNIQSNYLDIIDKAVKLSKEYDDDFKQANGHISDIKSNNVKKYFLNAMNTNNQNLFDLSHIQGIVGDELYNNILPYLNKASDDFLQYVETSQGTLLNDYSSFVQQLFSLDNLSNNNISIPQEILDIILNTLNNQFESILNTKEMSFDIYGGFINTFMKDMFQIENFLKEYTEQYDLRNINDVEKFKNTYGSDALKNVTQSSDQESQIEFAQDKINALKTSLNELGEKAEQASKKIDSLKEKVDDAFLNCNENYPLNRVNNQSQISTGTTAKDFYEKYGTPKQALDKGYFEDYDTLLNELGDDFKKLDQSASNFESQLETAFLNELIPQLSLTEEKLLVIKKLLSDAMDYDIGGKFRGWNGSEVDNDSLVANRQRLIKDILKDDYVITNEDIENARQYFQVINQSNETPVSTEVNPVLSEPDEPINQDSPTPIKVRPILNPQEFADEVTESLKGSSAEINVSPQIIDQNTFSLEVTNQLKGWNANINITPVVNSPSNFADEVTEQISSSTAQIAVEPLPEGEFDSERFAQQVTNRLIGETAHIDVDLSSNKEKESVNLESEGLQPLSDAIDDITRKVGFKTAAFVNEQGVVEKAVNVEKSKLKELQDAVEGVTTAVHDKTDAFNAEAKAVNAALRAEKKQQEQASGEKKRTQKKELTPEEKDWKETNRMMEAAKKEMTLWERKKELKKISDNEDLYKDKYTNPLQKYTAQYDKLNKDTNANKYLDDYKTKLESIGLKLEELRQYKLDIADPDSIKHVEELEKEIDGLFEDVEATAKKANAVKAASLVKQVTEYMGKNTKIGSDTRNELLELIEMAKAPDISDVELQNLYKRFFDIQTAIEAANKSGKGFIATLKSKVFYTFAQQIASFFSFNDIIRYGRQAVQNVINLNTQFTELAKVSDSTIKQLEKDFKSYADTAKDVGGTITDTISATADWARMGYNLPDSKELARVALIYKNVGDGIDISTANESLISTLQGFQMEAKDAMEIIDTFNEVSNNFAISSGGIGEALKRSAASFNAAGTDLQKSVALVTTANTVLQDPASVGTLWKTLSARIRSAKTELQDLGEEEDEFTESTSKLRDLVKSLTGFDIMKDADTYKDIYEIMIGIGKEWQNLTDVEQASLGEALAGKRNANALYSVLNNIDTLEKAYKTAEDSSGSAMREQERYQQSIQYSIDRTKASIEELSQTIISSDLIKFLVDVANGFVNITNEVVKFSGLLGTVGIGAGAFAGIKNFGVFTKQFSDIMKSVEALKELSNLRNGLTGLYDIDKYAEAIKGLNPQMAMLALSTKVLTDDEKKEILVRAGLVTSAEEVSVANGKLIISNKMTANSFKVLGNAALQSLKAFVTNPVVLLTASIVGIIAVTKTLRKAIEDIREQINEAGSEFNQKSKDLDDYKEKIDELQKTIKNSASSIDQVIDARKELLGIQDELIQKYGSEKESIDYITAALNGQADALDNVAAKEWERTKNKFNKSDWKNDLVNWSLGYSSNTDRMEKEMGDYISKVSYFQNLYSNSDQVKSVFEKYGWKYSENDNSFFKRGDRQALRDELEDIQKEVDPIVEDAVKKAITSELNATQEIIDQYQDIWEQWVSREIINKDPYLLQQFTKLQKEYEKYRKAIVNGDQDVALESLHFLAENLEKIFNDEEVDESVKAYFSRLYPTIQSELDRSNQFTAYKATSKTQAASLSGGYKGEYQSTIGYVRDKFDEAWEKEYTDFTSGFTSSDEFDRLNEFLAVYHNLSVAIREYKKEVYGSSFAFTDKQNEALDDYQSKLDKLNDALTKVHDGSITPDELMDLAQEYKELSLSAGNYEAQLQKIIRDSEKGIIKTLGLEEDESDELYKQYINLLKEMEYAGVKASDAIWGNINTNQRNEIRWTKDNLERYKSELESWGFNSKDLEGSRSTLLGMSEWFGDEEHGVEVAFTPILPDGTLLDSDSVYEYIESILEQADGDYDLALKLDTKGLIADIGETAIQTAENMHYTGQTGAYAEMYQEVVKAAKEANMTTKEWLDQHAEKAALLDTLKKITLEAQRVTKALNDAFSNIKNSSSALKELETAIVNKDVNESVLSTIGGINDELNAMVAGYYGGVVTIEQIHEKLKEVRESDFEEYKNAYVLKMRYDENYFKTVLENNKEFYKQLSKIEQEALKTSKSYEEAKLNLKTSYLGEYARRYAEFLDADGEIIEAKYNELAKNAQDLRGDDAAMYDRLSSYKKAVDKLKNLGWKDFDITLEGFDKNFDKINSSKSEYKDLFDFFERRIEIIDQALSKLDGNLENVNGHLSKNILIAGKIGIVSEEIKDYTSALAMYEEMANKELSKLSADLQDKIKNGAVDITQLIGESGEEVNKVLTDYQNWDNKVNDCNQKLIELKETLRDLALDKFNNIVQDYTDQFDLIGSSSDLIDKQIAVFEEAGQVIGKAFYESQIVASQKQRDLLEKEKAELIKELSSSLSSGYIQKGTDEWLEMVNSIKEVDSSILDCDQSIEQLQNSILELSDRAFERLQNQFSDLKNQMNNINSLLDDVDVSDEEGVWSKEGLTRMGMYADQYELARHNVEKYQEQIDQLNDAYADGLYSTTEYLDKLSDLAEQQWSEALAAEDARKSIMELNKARVDMIKQGIQKQIDKYKELIDAQKKALDQEKDLRDWQKTLEEKNKSITKLQNQIAVLSNDDSAAANAKRIKLQQELNDALADLEDTQYNHSIEKQKEALDQQMEDFEDERQKEIDALEEYLKDVELVQKDSLDTIKANADVVAQQLEEVVKTYGVVVSDTITNSWKQGEGALASYGDSLTTATSGFLAQIQTIELYLTALQDEADFTADKLVGMLSAKADNLLTEFNTARDSENELINATNMLHESLITALEGNYDVSKVVGAFKEVQKAAEAAKNASGDGNGSGGDGSGSGGGDTQGGDPQGSNPTPKANTNPNATPASKQLNYVEQQLNQALANENDPAFREMMRKQKDAELNAAWDNFQYKSYYYANGGTKPAYDNLRAAARDDRSADKLLGQIDYAYKQYQEELQKIVTKYAGYATGVHKLNKSQDGWTQEYGHELILSPTRNAVLTKLNKGDTVLTKEQTDNLFKLSKIDPSAIFGNMKIHTYGTNTTPTLAIGNVLTVNGNIDDTNIVKMQAVAKDAINKAFKQFSNEIIKR